jgi:hypothetical protein
MSWSFHRTASLATLLTLALVAGCKSYRSSVLAPDAGATLKQSGALPTRGGGGGVPVPPPTTTPLTITTTSLGPGNVGTFFGGFITASGGSGSPLTFRLVSGAVPAGLSLARSLGVQSTSLSGTPTTVQTSNFSVQVSDPAGHTASRAFTLAIGPAVTLVITNQSPILAPGTVGAPYAISLFANGGVQPFNWAIAGGALPGGLALRGNTISGTPSARGTFTFTARVTDAHGAQASEQFSITIG